jgi:hypothetical protein
VPIARLHLYDASDKTVGDLAWSRTLAFFAKNLGAPPLAGSHLASAAQSPLAWVECVA